jgi:hypothetical protein
LIAVLNGLEGTAGRKKCPAQFDGMEEVVGSIPTRSTKSIDPVLESRSRLLQNDSELPFVVETPYIWVDRLRLANQRALAGKSLSERPEAPVGIDVVHD